MKTWWRVPSLVGVGCSSLCFLALPLLLLWAPAFALGWLHDERLARGMLVMFLAMALIGGADAYRHHCSPRPGMLAAAGGGLLLLAAWKVGGELGLGRGAGRYRTSTGCPRRRSPGRRLCGRPARSR